MVSLVINATWLGNAIANLRQDKQQGILLVTSACRRGPATSIYYMGVMCRFAVLVIVRLYKLELISESWEHSRCLLMNPEVSKHIWNCYIIIDYLICGWTLTHCNFLSYTHTVSCTKRDRYTSLWGFHVQLYLHIKFSHLKKKST